MNKQRGFALVMAIFILVVLTLLAAYMVKLSGVQHHTSVSVLQGARAYQAAKAGIEWGIYRLTQDSCVADTVISPLAGFNGFSIHVNCSNQGLSYNEGDSNADGLDNDDFYIYLITSTASFGDFSNSDYVFRQLKATVSAP